MLSSLKVRFKKPYILRKFSTLKPWTGTLAKLILFQEGTSLIVLHLSPAYERQLLMQEKQLLIICPSRPLLTLCNTSFPSLKLKSNLFSSWWHSAGHLSLKKCCSRKFLPPIIHSRGLHTDYTVIGQSTAHWAMQVCHRKGHSRARWIHCSAVSKIQATAEGRLHWVKASTPEWKLSTPLKTSVFLTSGTKQLSMSLTVKHDFPVQQTWTWPSNCTAGYSRLIIQRAHPTGQYHIEHFLKAHILLTINWEVWDPRLGF